MSQATSPALHNAWPHRIAVVLCCATFPLIWAGGLVTTYDAGMAVPDWPGTYGYNLWLYPWSTWFFGPWDLFIEHGHRLLATFVGFLAIALVIAVHRSSSHIWLRPLAWIGLAGVLLQGGLGGARVILDDRQVAMIHAIVGPCFFAYCGALAVMTSRYWQEVVDLRSQPPASHDALIGLRRFATVTAGLVLLQMFLGAQIRHISIMAEPGQFRALVFFHLIVAFALLIHAAILIVKARRCRAQLRNVTVPAVLLAVLVGMQFILGPATWVVNYGWPQWFAELPFAIGHTVQAKSLLQTMIVTAHVAVGSLVLANAVVVTVRSFRSVHIEATAVGSTAMLVGLAS